MHKFHFIPECHAETEMVKILFKGLDFYKNHQKGIDKVSKVLKSDKMMGKYNIGFVDNDDHNIPKHFDEYNILNEQNHVIFKKHQERNRYLIIVDPAMERFLHYQLDEIQKTPSDFGLPNDFKQFRHVLKNSQLERNENYKRMIRELQHANTSGISFIIECVSGLDSAQ